MAYPTPRPPLRALGGRPQRWRRRSLFAAMAAVGVYPGVDGVSYLVPTSDIHHWIGLTSTLAPSIAAEIEHLKPNPPECVVGVGDFMTDLVPAFGYGPYTGNGAVEAADANVQMPLFASLAPLRCVTGNHDTWPNESPVGGYIDTNCPWFNGPNHSWVCAGVHCIALSSSHDARLVNGQSEYLANVLAAIEDDHDVIIFVHQPSFGSRVAESGIQTGIMAALPAGFSNPMWLVGGHNHVYSESKFQLPSTTLVQWGIGATSPIASSADKTNPALSAIACRDGRVIGRWAFDGKTLRWTYIEQPNRAVGLTDPPGRLDGLGGLPALATYLEGDYPRAGKIITAENTTWRETGSWMPYVSAIEVAFPVPVGATKFWALMNGAPTSPQMSADGSSWEGVSVPAESLGMRIFDSRNDHYETLQLIA
jgi:hypothetical protein